MQLTKYPLLKTAKEKQSIPSLEPDGENSSGRKGLNGSRLLLGRWNVLTFATHWEQKQQEERIHSPEQSLGGELFCSFWTNPRPGQSDSGFAQSEVRQPWIILGWVYLEQSGAAEKEMVRKSYVSSVVVVGRRRCRQRLSPVWKWALNQISGAIHSPKQMNNLAVWHSLEASSKYSWASTQVTSCPWMMHLLRTRHGPYQLQFPSILELEWTQKALNIMY